MNIYFAPLEGITGYIYRNTHHKFYPGIDKYFTPFLSPGPEKGVGRKEIRDVLPENNPGICLIPQILTNRAEDFIKTASVLSEMGYREINLNLGCPSGTVVSKGKGAGFLAHSHELDRFLDRIFTESKPEISIKTRIGKTSPDEFGPLLEIYNRYPLKELIIHPRIQTDLYKNHPNLPVYREAAVQSKSPVVYNGDLFAVEDFVRFAGAFPETETIMLGRGIIADPGLAEKIRKPTGMDSAAHSEEMRRLKAFLDELCVGYQAAFSGDRNVLFKMKEIWCYMIRLFPDSGKLEKRIKKAQSLAEYQAAKEALFYEYGGI